MRYRNDRFGLGGGFGTPPGFGTGYNYPEPVYNYNVGQGYPGTGYGYPSPGYGGVGMGYSGYYPSVGYGPGFGSPGFGGPGFGGYGISPLTTGLLGLGVGLLGGAALDNDDGPFRGYYY